MDEIIGLAMVGTQRRSPTWKEPLLRELPGAPQAQLLSGACVLSLRALAGRPLGQGSALPRDEGIDPRAPAPLRCLRRILSDSDLNLMLPEWLRLASEAGRRPPAEILPELLEAGRRNHALRAPLREVGGARAEWLAGQNPAWNYFLGANEKGEDFWETGPASGRIEGWSRLRLTDPGRARQLLQSTWREESAEDRQKCLSAFRPGLGPEDEEFLESALDDRSLAVRRLAARLLAALPCSALRQRIAAQVRLWIGEKSGSAWLGLKKTLTLEVLPPESCSAALQRDGIEAKPPRGVGEKSWWLQQGVALAPLSLWRSSPLELLAAASKSDWSEPLLAGWREAACNQENSAWAEALLQAGQTDGQLFLLLPQERREQLLLSRPQWPWLFLHGSFSPELAQFMLESLRKVTATPFEHVVGHGLPDLALAFPPSWGQLCEQGWPEGSTEWGRWRGPVERFISRLKFRQAMNEEMQS